VNSVSAAEIQAVAQKYLVAERAQIVAVGDAARIRPALDKPGKLEA
jgi:predicted Zn-dependent peptidase